MDFNVFQSLCVGFSVFPHGKFGVLDYGTQHVVDYVLGTYPESLVLVAHEPNDKTQGSHIRGSSLRAAIAGDEQVDLLAGTTR